MVFEARAAEFGLQQQPRPAAVTPAAAAPRPPAAAAAAAGDVDAEDAEKRLEHSLLGGRQLK